MGAIATALHGDVRVLFAVEVVRAREFLLGEPLHLARVATRRCPARGILALARDASLWVEHVVD